MAVNFIDESNGLERELGFLKWVDVIAFTCSTIRDALGVKQELELMQRNGLLGNEMTSILTIEDPTDGGIGSGGATLNAILVVAEHLSAKHRFPVVNPDVLKTNKILIVHNGRFYPYELCGKAFIPLDELTNNLNSIKRSFILETNLGNLLKLIDNLMISLKPNYQNGGVWVCSTDALIINRLSTNNQSIEWPSNQLDCVLFTVPCNLNYASDHGVVQINNLNSENRKIVDNILYRRPVDQLIHLSIDSIDNKEDIKVPVVCGIVFMSSHLAQSLFKLQTNVPIDSCTYLGSDSGTVALQVSLFFDILAAMAAKMTMDDFVKGDCGKTYGLHRTRNQDSNLNSMIQVRTLVWNQLSNYTMDASIVLDDMEYIYWPETLPASNHLDIVRRRHRHRDRDSFSDSELIEINSALNRVEITGSGSRNSVPVVVQNSVLRGSHQHPVRIGRGSIISGLQYIESESDKLAGVHFRLIIPENLVLMRVRLINKGGVYVIYGTKDNLFAELTIDETATICNSSWADFAEKTGINQELLWDQSTKEKTLLTAKLFPICDDIENVMWFMSSSTQQVKINAKLNWSLFERVSLAEISTEVDVPAEFHFRRDNIQLQLAVNQVHHVIFDGGQESLLPLFERASNRTWVFGLLDEMDKMAASAMSKQIHLIHNGCAARVFANIADLLGCLASRDRGFRSGPAANKQWAQVMDILEEATDVDIVQKAITDLSEVRKNWMDSPERLIRAARHYEAAAQILTRNVVATANSFVKVIDGDLMPAIGDWVVSECPARVDLFGGWTDTPPICYELGGSVVNASIVLNGQRPIGAKVRRLLSMDIEVHSDDGRPPLTIGCVDDVRRDYKKPSSPGALVKACLIYTKIIELDEVKHGSLIEQLKRKYNGGFEIHTFSKLPLGSGLGTSSILASAILTSLWLAVGKTVDRLSLVHAVLCVEQMMTTGGGWQDQVGGLMGGIIHGESKMYPSESKLESGSSENAQESGLLKVQVKRLQLDPRIMDHLRRHLIVVYTGTARLARNLLQNVLRNWYCRDAQVVQIFNDLYSMSYRCVDALQTGNLDEIGSYLNHYWELKKALTPGAEPEHVHLLMNQLRPHCHGQLLCGAGGGGHLVLLTRQPDAQSLVRQVISQLPNMEDVVVMEASIDEQGICAEIGGVKVEIN